MPFSLGALFRGVLLVLMAGYVFVMFATVRLLAGTYGFQFGSFVVACLVSMALMVPLVWIIGLPELPEIYVTHWRAQRRWKRGLCPGCAYVLRLHSPDGVCPECGRQGIPPESYRFGRRTIMRFVVLFVLAWMVGCVASEVWMCADESAFEQEADAAMQASTEAQYVRPRRWPAGSVPLTFVRGQGVVSSEDDTPPGK